MKTTLERLYTLREQTTCRLGWHCKPERGIRKFGDRRLLCRYCHIIIGHWE